MNTSIYLNFMIHRNMFKINRDFKIIQQHKTLTFTQKTQYFDSNNILD